MKISTEKKISIGFGTALSMMIIISFFSYRSIRQLTAAADSRSKAYAAHKSAAKVLSHLERAETGQRGFLLTGKDSYLEPYFTGLKGVQTHTEKLHRLNSDNTNQDEHLKILCSLISEKLAELQKTIDLRRLTNGFEASRQIVLTDRGKRLMDEIRRTIVTTEVEQETMVTERDNLVRAHARFAVGIIALGCLFAVTVVIVAGKVIRKELAIRRQVKEELSKFAQDLEQKNGELQEALSQVKTLGDLLPICAGCKKIRDDKGYWNQIELFIRERSGTKFSHGICPECMHKLYPQLYPQAVAG